MANNTVGNSITHYPQDMMGFWEFCTPDQVTANKLVAEGWQWPEPGDGVIGVFTYQESLAIKAAEEYNITIQESKLDPPDILT